MHLRRAPRWPSLTLAAALALGATPARAQATAEEKAAAESLFSRALSLMAADQAAEACPIFEEVVRITNGLGAQYELAKCYEKAGRLASAWATYREVGQRDRGRRAKDARAAAERIEAALAHLTVEVPPTMAALPGLEVRRDGRPILREVWGMSIPVDPGEHRVEASAKGKATWSVQVTLAQGGSRSIIVGPLADETTAPSSSPPSPVAPPTTPRSAPLEGGSGSSRGQTQRIVGLSVAGAGLLGLGAGVLLGLDAKSKYDEQRKNGACDDDGVCSRAGDDASREARTRGDIGTIVGGVGVAALVGGFVLFLTAPSSKAPTAAAHASPSLTWHPRAGRGQAALDLALRW